MISLPRRRRPVWAILILGLAFLPGCKPGEVAWISGTCSFDGKPIDDGNIRLDPVEGTPGGPAAVKIRSGRFEIDRERGLYAGTYLVTVSASRETGRRIAAAEVLDGGPATIAETVPYIPEKYNAHSTLKVTLNPGENSHDFPLDP